MRTKLWVNVKTTGFDEEVDEIHQLSVKYGKKELNYYIRFKQVPSHDLFIPFGIRRVTLEDAMLGLFVFIEEIAKKEDPQGEGLTFAGKDPLFDWKFLMKIKIFQELWKKYFQSNLFDLTTIIYFLKDLGLFPDEQSSDLEELVSFFDIKIKDGKPHDAYFDTRATYEIYQKSIESVKKGKKIKNTDPPLLEVHDKADIKQGEGLGKKKTTKKKTTKKKPVKK